MKLQFDANQDYQRDAVGAAVELFKGQPAGSGEFTLAQTMADEHGLPMPQVVAG